MFSRLKEYIAEILKSRFVVLFLFFCVLFLVIVQRLFTLQIVEGEDYLENYTLKIKKTTEVQ